jgi:hypothetical protein
LRLSDTGTQIAVQLEDVIGRLKSDPDERRELDETQPSSDVEPAELAGLELPDREVMSLLDAHVAIPINAAVAANVLSDDSGAFAVSDQDTGIDQAT